jgi:hypothetical protein
MSVTTEPPAIAAAVDDSFLPGMSAVPGAGVSTTITFDAGAT